MEALVNGFLAGLWILGTSRSIAFGEMGSSASGGFMLACWYLIASKQGCFERIRSSTGRIVVFALAFAFVAAFEAGRRQ
jgi:hypothetical protein